MGHQQDATGEAAVHQVLVQGDLNQALDDSEATTEANGLRHLHQTCSADVQRDSEDDPGPLQGQVNCQQAGHLVNLGQGGRALVARLRHWGMPPVSQEPSSVGVRPVKLGIVTQLNPSI